MEITVKKVEILIGDVFKLQLSNGIGFIQCVKLAPETECEIIREPLINSQDNRSFVK
jgi:hypothetical protein